MLAAAKALALADQPKLKLWTPIIITPLNINAIYYIFIIF